MISKFDRTTKRPLSGQRIGQPNNRFSNCSPQHSEGFSCPLPFTRAPNTSQTDRGSGRSEGNAGLGKRSTQILDFNEKTGLLCCGAQVTIEKIVRVFSTRGWFPTITPDTQFITVGDAVAFDVRGNNHHQEGSFSRCVRRLTLVLASGETVSCSREKHSDLFWATVGGMGLTGTLIDVEFFLRPIETAYCKTVTLKTRDLLDTLAQLEKHAPQYQYAVAWMDCLASGDFLGRSLLTLGNDATLEDLNPSQRVRPLEMEPQHGFRVPFDVPLAVLNRYTAGLANEIYYHRQRSSQVETIVDYNSFFYPQDSNGNDGKRGFVRYELAIPTSVSREGLTCILKFLGSKGKGCNPVSAVLKRLGDGEGGLSLPVPGYSLALDIPMQPEIEVFLSQLDRIVLEYGGRVYLTPDSRLHPQVFRQMYPGYDRWLSVKSQVDPQNRFRSALSDRLQIEPTGKVRAA
ncbi:MAG: FAD-binding protein [Geitlerinemataceae cyanobacterium]